jgi:PST family polysaccharide transporter
VPTRLFQTLMFLPSLVSMAWLPRLVTAHEEGEGRLHEEARRPLELLLVASLPLCAATAAAAAPMLHLLYGSAYDRSAPVLVALGLTIPPMYVNIMLNQVLVAAGRQTAWTWMLAGATVVNPLLNLALIPFAQHRYGNGAAGAGVALFLTELGIVTGGLLLFGRGLVDRRTLRRVAPSLIASALLWATAWLLRPVSPLGGLVAGGVVFLVAAKLLGVLTPEEIAWARDVARKRFRKAA